LGLAQGMQPVPFAKARFAEVQSAELSASTPPAWYRYTPPWWGSMYDQNKVKPLVNTAGQKGPLDLPGYAWVSNPPTNAVPTLLGFQSGGMGQIMLEEKSKVRPVAQPKDGPSFHTDPSPADPIPELTGKTPDEILANAAPRTVNLDVKVEKSAIKLEKKAEEKLEEYRHHIYTYIEPENSADPENSAGRKLLQLPDKNPDMVPIPPAVHDIIEESEQAPPSGYPTIPVYQVKETGKAFVPNGGTFQAQVGPDGSGLANNLLQNVKNAKKLKKDMKTLNNATQTNEKAATDLQSYRDVVNKEVSEPKAMGIVKALKKVVIKPPASFL